MDLKNQHEILALRYCSRFLFLKDRRIFAYGGLEVMTGDTIAWVYGIPVSLHRVDNITLVIPKPGSAPENTQAAFR
jgi:iron complex transport system ATP-binding protein